MRRAGRSGGRTLRRSAQLRPPGRLAAWPPPTVGGALRSARRMLEQAGIPDQRREADQLYAAILGEPSSAGWLRREQRVPPRVLERLRDATARRAAGWPQAYAVGRANFRGHWLAVDRRVLIPRPETEGLVELVLRWASAAPAAGPQGLVAVDVGTGCGAIAIALALESPLSGIIATDVSPQALQVAMANGAALGVGPRISFRSGPLLAPLLGEQVDAVVSNPPYVAADEWATLDASVRRYEPRVALDGGPDGLMPTRALVLEAREALRPGGLLALEVDARRAAKTAALVEEAGFAQVAVRHDLFGRARYLCARKRVPK